MPGDKISCDVLIVGAGPAGWSAAIYTSRAGLSTVVLGVLANSNLYKAHVVENYYGFEKTVSGPFIMNEGKAQALKFGSRHVEREVVSIKANDDGIFAVQDSELNEYEARAIIICSGLGFKPSGIKNEQALTGRGVSFCATCDGYFFKGKKIAVIGNSHFAGEEALALLSYTPDVTILSHGKEFAFTPKMQEGLDKHGIKLLKTARFTEFVSRTGGGQTNTQPVFEKIKSTDGVEYVFDGAFVALGVATAADFANKLGILRTGPQNAFIVADPRTGETNVPGVYAAGDCTGGNAQAAKSAGEGCNAAISVIKRLKGVSAYVDYD